MRPEDYLREISYSMIEPPDYSFWTSKGGRGNGKTILSNREVEYLKIDKNITMETGKMYWEKSNLPKIKKVIFNYPATIIIWEDGSKTVVKCMDGDTWDPEKGFMAAYLTKILGQKRFHSELKKYVKPQVEMESDTTINGNIRQKDSGMHHRRI